MSGTLHVVGVGPGDPELMTLKAARLIGAAEVLAWFCKRGRTGHAHAIAAPLFRPDAERLAFQYPHTTEIAVDDPAYGEAMDAFYAEAAGVLADRLRAGRDVTLLCEGDPFFYGSAMYLFDRLGPGFPTQVVPGVTGMSGCWAQAGLPMTHGDDVLSVLPGTMETEALVAALAACDAAVIMKLGSNLPKVRDALARTGLVGRAVYVERGTMPGGRVVPFAALDDARVPYFAMVLVPGRQGRR